MKHIYCQPLGGLCNRMRVIVSSIILAKKLNRKLYILWTQDSSLNSVFSDLFQPISFNIIDCKLSSIKYKFIYHYIKDLKKCQILNDNWIQENARGLNFDTWKDKILDKDIFIYSNLDIIYGGDYTIFKPLDSVVKTLNNISIDSHTIGLHIRRTDNINAVKYSPTKLFFNKIYEEISINKNVKFYLATDDPNEENQFIQEFGDRIIIYKKHSLDRNNPIAIKDALVDLYNLSCCTKIYGSYYSSFSDTAALWSGIDKIELKLGK